MKRFIKLFIVSLLFLFIILIGKKISEPNAYNFYMENITYNDASNEVIQNTVPALDSSNSYEPIFTSEEIPENIYEKMLGKSIPTKYKDKVDLSSLKYLQISYLGFDGESHVR